MKESITITPFYSNDPDLESIADLYCATFLAENYYKKEKENVITNLKKHGSYQGFIGCKATDKKGNVVGFTYGYTSQAQQYYRQKIAKQLSNLEVKKWLVDCFEFVELAVSPSYKRLGIGGALHDALLKMTRHKTSILTTSIANSPAIQLYRKKGWKIIKKDAPVISEDNLQVIMGKEIH